MGEMADMLLDQLWHDWFGYEDTDDWLWDNIYSREHRPLPKDEWMTKDGTIMKLKDMTEMHLENSIAMCARIHSLKRLQVLMREKARRNKQKAKSK